MQKKNTFSSKKLISYAASATAFLAVNNANATVVYTDLDPDQVIAGEGAEVSLDINDDGINDFTFIVTSLSGTGTYYGISFTYGANIAGAIALNGNEFLGSVTTYSGYSGVYAPVLPSGEGINEDDQFVNGAPTLGISVAVSLLGFPYYDYQAGNWLGVDMGYMGFRLNIDKDRFYGWMRVSVNGSANSITIHDYAYENEANKAIFTDQTATAINENPLAQADIYANGGQVFINLPELNSNNADVNIYDMSGKLVKNQSLSNGNNVCNCNNLPSANYIVHVTEGQLTIKKQIAINN